MKGGPKRGGLRHQLINQGAARNLGIRGNVINGLFGVQGAALAAHIGQHIHNITRQPHHAAGKNPKQAHRTRTNDHHIRHSLRRALAHIQTLGVHPITRDGFGEKQNLIHRQVGGVQRVGIRGAAQRGHRAARVLVIALAQHA